MKKILSIGGSISLFALLIYWLTRKRQESEDGANEDSDTGCTSKVSSDPTSKDETVLTDESQALVDLAPEQNTLVAAEQLQQALENPEHLQKQIVDTETIEQPAQQAIVDTKSLQQTSLNAGSLETDVVDIKPLEQTLVDSTTSQDLVDSTSSQQELTSSQVVQTEASVKQTSGETALKDSEESLVLEPVHVSYSASVQRAENSSSSEPVENSDENLSSNGDQSVPDAEGLIDQRTVDTYPDTQSIDKELDVDKDFVNIDSNSAKADIDEAHDTDVLSEECLVTPKVQSFISENGSEEISSAVDLSSAETYLVQKDDSSVKENFEPEALKEEQTCEDIKSLSDISESSATESAEETLCKSANAAACVSSTESTESCVENCNQGNVTENTCTQNSEENSDSELKQLEDASPDSSSPIPSSENGADTDANCDNGVDIDSATIKSSHENSFCSVTEEAASSNIESSVLLNSPEAASTESSVEREEAASEEDLKELVLRSVKADQQENNNYHSQTARNMSESSWFNDRTMSVIEEENNGSSTSSSESNANLCSDTSAPNLGTDPNSASAPNGSEAVAKVVVDSQVPVEEVVVETAGLDAAMADLSLEQQQLECYYENHVYPLLEENQFSSIYDYRAQWEQPKDEGVFVEGVAGQPLVPKHLRDPVYLNARQVPAHDPIVSANLFSVMKPLVHPPSLWVRVISVSDELELRVRQDQRDMLLEHFTTRAEICNPKGPPPNPDRLRVGALVAAHMKLPCSGQLAWCRVRITAVRDTKKSAIEGGERPPRRYCVESIDHYVGGEDEALPIAKIRLLNELGLSLPFYDQLVYLRNVMPRNKIAYPESARAALLSIIARNNNFLYLADPVFVNVSGVTYWIADPIVCVNGANVCVSQLLVEQQQGKRIFHGAVTPDTCFDNCMFRAREAFWAMDNRKANPERSLKGIGIDLQRMEYAFVATCMQEPFVVFTGFSLPYQHHQDKWKCKGFNLSINELMTLYSRQFRGNPTTNEDLANLKQHFSMNLTYDALMSYYVSDADQARKPDALVVYSHNITTGKLEHQGRAGYIVFPKDINGFLFIDTKTGMCPKFSELRRPAPMSRRH